VFDHGVQAPAFQWSFAGSPMALALSDDGARIAAARKSSHANQFSTSGEVTLLDTGERDLQLVGPSRPGGVLRLAFLHPGAQQALFGVGSAASQPGAPPGLSGMLLLDLTQPLLAFPRPVDGVGRADLGLPIPAGPAVVGLPLASQALALGVAPPALSATLAMPAIL